LSSFFSRKPIALDNPSVTDFLNSFFKPVLLAANPQGVTILILLLLILLLISFFVAGAEVAFFSLTYKDINMLKTKQHPAARRIISLLDQPKTLLASLLITNSFVNIGIIILSNFVIDEFVTIEAHYFWVEFLIKVIAVTFLLVLFGEILPKVWATQNNIRFAYSASLLVEVVNSVFKGFSNWLVGYADRIERGLGHGKSNVYSLEELDHAIDLTTHQDATEEEKNILKGIVKFGNITVKQIMKTRLDVSGIDINTSFGELVKRVEDLHYSRLPVYKQSMDEVVGMIHTKDLMPYLAEEPEFEWQKLMRQPFFVPEQKLIEDLLREFQSKRIHFAVVVDEFGGTEGIVTLEDILEEIIGDIKDEFDDEESGNKKLDDYNYIFEGRTMINDASKAMGIPAETFDRVRGESESLAGLLLELAGEIPQVNSEVPCGDFTFTVQEIDKNRIKKVKVTIKPQPPED